MSSLSKEGTIIKKLRAKIPSFACKEGCHDCCGPVPFSKWEWSQITDHRKQIDLTCPYLGENGCDIYEHRPLICRVMGTVEGLKCVHGCGPKHILSKQEEHALMKKYVPFTK